MDYWWEIVLIRSRNRSVHAEASQYSTLGKDDLTLDEIRLGGLESNGPGLAKVSIA